MTEKPLLDHSTQQAIEFEKPLLVHSTQQAIEFEKSLLVHSTQQASEEHLAIRRIFSLVDMITNTKFSNCPNVFKIGVVWQ